MNPVRPVLTMIFLLPILASSCEDLQVMRRSSVEASLAPALELALTYPSAAALIEDARAKGAANRLYIDGIQSGGDVDPPIHYFVDTTTGIAVYSHGAAIRSLPLAVFTSALIGSYDSVMTLRQRAMALLFERCIRINGALIHPGTDPCLLLGDAGAHVPMDPVPSAFPAPGPAPVLTPSPAPAPATTPTAAIPGVDPGFGTGLWQPAGRTNVFVADQSGINGGITASIIPGCVNGGSSSFGAECRATPWYDGVLNGQRVRIRLTAGQILSLRYRVNREMALEAYSGYFKLYNVGGGPILYDTTISVSATPGDFSDTRCQATGTGNPRVSTGSGYCPIDPSRDLYYVNIRTNVECSECVFSLGENSKAIY